jgi:hypothetical protein
MSSRPICDCAVSAAHHSKTDVSQSESSETVYYNIYDAAHICNYRAKRIMSNEETLPNYLFLLGRPNPSS